MTYLSTFVDTSRITVGGGGGGGGDDQSEITNTITEQYNITTESNWWDNGTATSSSPSSCNDSPWGILAIVLPTVNIFTFPYTSVQ